MPRRLVAYHGSPVQFDKFDTRFVGTGQGESHHGWGINLAKNEDVARHYRDATSSFLDEPGHLYEVAVDADPSSFIRAGATFERQSPLVQETLTNLGFDPSGRLARRGADGRKIYENLLRKQAYSFMTQGPIARRYNIPAWDMAGDWLGRDLSDAGVLGLNYRRKDGHRSGVLVVFPGAEDRLTILRRYGVLGPLLTAGATNQDGIPTDATMSPLSGLTAN